MSTREEHMERLVAGMALEVERELAPYAVAGMQGVMGLVEFPDKDFEDRIVEVAVTLWRKTRDAAQEIAQKHADAIPERMEAYVQSLIEREGTMTAAGMKDYPKPPRV